MEHSTYCSTEIMELAKAILKVQLELQPALKNAENTFSKSRYATLNSVMDACRAALINNGIWLTQYPVPVEGAFMGLVTKLTHAETGEWQSGLMMMPLPKADPQGYGSAMTYGRRYALSAMLGIVTEEDDDGLAGAMPTAENGKRKRQPAERAQQAKCATAKGSTSCTDPEQAAPSKQGVNSAAQMIQTNQANQTNQAHPALQSMPKLDGIAYSLTTTKDGKTCIVATGNTTSKKQILSQAGFTWSDQRKVWWRYADAA